MNKPLEKTSASFDAEKHHLAIKPLSKRNGITLTIAGSIGLLLGVIIFLTSQTLLAFGVVCFGFGAISLVLGIGKLVEPDTSLMLDDDGVVYYHRRGKVAIEWSNIQRVDIPRVSQDLQWIDLPYIGIKLKSLNPILNNISPRLATGLLTEQRPLLMTATAQSEHVGALETQLHTEFTPLHVNGGCFKGVQAMFGHRCEILNQHIGYHLYISTDCLDRDAEVFLPWFRQIIAERIAVSCAEIDNQ